MASRRKSKVAKKRGSKRKSHTRAVPKNKTGPRRKVQRRVQRKSTYTRRRLHLPELIESHERGTKILYKKERVRFKASRGRKLTPSGASAKKIVERIRDERKRHKGKRDSEEISIKISYRDKAGHRRTRWDNFSSKNPKEIEAEITRFLTHYTYENSKGKVFSIENFSVQHFEYQSLKTIPYEERKILKAYQARTKTRKNRRVRHRNK